MSLPARNYKNKTALEILSAQNTLSLAILEFFRNELQVYMYDLSGNRYILCNSNKKYIYLTISDLVSILPVVLPNRYQLRGSNDILFSLTTIP